MLVPKVIMMLPCGIIAFSARVENRIIINARWTRARDSKSKIWRHNGKRPFNNGCQVDAVVDWNSLISAIDELIRTKALPQGER